MLRVLVSSKLDAYYHLALEHHYLYQDSEIEEKPLLLIYQNSPSVVFGNFQNPWLEVNVPFCRDKNIKLVRRFSGGGCVYHDLGNINFCYIGPKNADSRKVLHQLLINFFQAQKIILTPGEKSDLLSMGQKISGSAFRETKNRTLHHCTLLFNSDLEILNLSLRSPLNRAMTQTKALPSRPAKVTTLKQIGVRYETPKALIKDFCESLPEVEIISPQVDLEMKWDSWEQIFGKTPTFNWKGVGVEIQVELGHLSQVILNNQQPIKFSEEKIALEQKNEPLVKHLGVEIVEQFKAMGFF